MNIFARNIGRRRKKAGNRACFHDQTAWCRLNPRSDISSLPMANTARVERNCLPCFCTVFFFNLHERKLFFHNWLTLSLRKNIFCTFSAEGEDAEKVPWYAWCKSWFLIMIQNLLKHSKNVLISFFTEREQVQPAEVGVCLVKSFFPPFNLSTCYVVEHFFG